MILGRLVVDAWKVGGFEHSATRALARSTLGEVGGLSWPGTFEAGGLEARSKNIG